MNRIRLLGTIAFLLLLFCVLLAGIDSYARRLHASREARRRVAEALALAGKPERQMALFQQARVADPAYSLSCEQGVQFERWGHYAEAAASFRACFGSDPNQAYAYLAHAKNLVWAAQGSDDYLDARSALRHFLELAPEDPVASRDAVSRHEAVKLVRDLEDLLEDENPHGEADLYSKDDLLRILLRTPERGASRYDGPRVPLRLGFRPGDAVFGVAAEQQLWGVAQALKDGRLARAKIRIEGHTDSVEGRTRKARSQIAVRRAEAVRTFLMRRCGIPASRLSVTGYADDYPLEPNNMEGKRARNRRVELVNLTTQEVVRGDARDW